MRLTDDVVVQITAYNCGLENSLVQFYSTPVSLVASKSTKRFDKNCKLPNGGLYRTILDDQLQSQSDLG